MIINSINLIKLGAFILIGEERRRSSCHLMNMKEERTTRETRHLYKQNDDFSQRPNHHSQVITKNFDSNDRTITIKNVWSLRN